MPLLDQLTPPFVEIGGRQRLGRGSQRELAGVQRPLPPSRELIQIGRIGVRHVECGCPLPGSWLS